jgi:hypothetical protein
VWVVRIGANYRLGADVHGPMGSEPCSCNRLCGLKAAIAMLDLLIGDLPLVDSLQILIRRACPAFHPIAWRYSASAG